MVSRSASLAGSCPCEQTEAMDHRSLAHLHLIQAVTDELVGAGVTAWLFGGWGLDATIGRLTREHGDVGFWFERVNAARCKAVLVTTGAVTAAHD